MPNKGTDFQAEEFLDDVKHNIKRLYGNQSNFAALIPVSRNVISRLVNNPDALPLYWLRYFARMLNLNLGDYIF